MPNPFESWNQSTDRFDSSEENCDNADPLQRCFPFTTATCRHNEAFTCGECSECFHARFTEVNQGDHPNRGIACCDKAHENRHVRNLVAERVEVLAERTDFAHRAGELAVQKICEHKAQHHYKRKDFKHEVVVAVIQIVIVEEHPEEKRRKHNAAHGELACD